MSIWWTIVTKNWRKKIAQSSLRKSHSFEEMNSANPLEASKFLLYIHASIWKLPGKKEKLNLINISNVSPRHPIVSNWECLFRFRASQMIQFHVPVRFSEDISTFQHHISISEFLRFFSDNVISSLFLFAALFCSWYVNLLVSFFTLWRQSRRQRFRHCN